jgi:hypothetical protein
MLSSLLTILLLFSGCTTDDSPLSAKAESLLGTWRLPLGEIPEDEFKFSYTFKKKGEVTNKIGGAFLQRLRDLAEAQEIDLGELNNLEQIDGANLNLSGTWTADGDTLCILFTQAEVELFGTLPIVGQVGVPVHREPLPAEENVDIRFTCILDGNELNLRGDALTVGISLGQGSEEIQIEALGPLGNEALRLAREQWEEVIQQEELNEVTLIRD